MDTDNGEVFSPDVNGDTIFWNKDNSDAVPVKPIHPRVLSAILDDSVNKKQLLSRHFRATVAPFHLTYKTNTSPIWAIACLLDMVE